MESVSVRYNNDFNLLPMPELTAKEMDIFMLIVSKFQYQSRELEIDGYEFFRALKEPKESYQRLFEVFESFADKILSFNIKYKTDKFAYAFVCFESLKMDFSTNKIKIKAQEDFFNMILNFKLGYTYFELLEFSNLSGIYTKNLYRLLKQYRQTGWLEINFDEFKRIMQIPQNYKMGNIDQKVLEPALKELTAERNLFDTKRIPFKDLSYTKIKGKGRGRGGNIIAIRFDFKPEQIQELESQTEKAKPTNTKEPNLKAYCGLYVDIPTTQGRVTGKITNIYETNEKIIMEIIDENFNTTNLPFDNLESLEKCINTYKI